MSNKMAIDGKSERTLWLLIAAACGLLVAALYGSALSLPFFFDDFVHYPFVEANSQARIWLTIDELAYYRPLNFSIWRLTYDLFQRHVPAVDHGINLLLFAASGFLVGWLAGCLWPRMGPRSDWWRVVISAVLFLFFPFSYQAVPWAGSLSHITVTLLILISLAAYVQMRRTGRRRWGAVSLLAAFLAPFAHENGILVMPFIVLIELTTPDLANRWRRAFYSGLVWSLPLLLYMPIWLSLPRLDSGALFSNSLEGMMQNSAYFIQGAMYPFTGLGGWLSGGLGMRDMTAVALLSLAGLAAALLVQIRQRAGLRSLLPWLWIGLASLPAVLFLVFDYVINGPRLLMVASVGIAWLWADVILLFSRGAAKGTSQRLLRGGVALLFTALLLAQNARFIRARLEMHTILGDGFWQVIDATSAANRAGESAVVVNFPSWLAPKQATFALGHEGVLFWPDYVPPALLTAVHTGELGDLSFVKVDSIRPELARFLYGLTGPNPDWPSLSAVPAQVLSTIYEDRDLVLAPAGEVGPAASGRTSPLVTFSDNDGRTAAAVLTAGVEAGSEGIRVDTIWQSDGTEPGVTIFVHAVDKAGNLVGQADGDPLAGSYPLDQWAPGTRLADSRYIPLENSEGIQLRLGLYDRQTGERLIAQGGPDVAIADVALLLAPTYDR
ncbi:MAG: hypothetical protein ACK2UK_21310 [Candidatus Promineifilaceae bacterium]